VGACVVDGAASGSAASGSVTTGREAPPLIPTKVNQTVTTSANNVTANNIGLLTNKGIALFNLERYTEAIKYFDKALAIDPQYVDALNNKGRALSHLGNYTGGIEYFDKALAIDPNYISALNNCCIYLHR
jgi:tetratricopeptide (TPR) repeat protein